MPELTKLNIAAQVKCPKEFEGKHSCDDLGVYKFSCAVLRNRYNLTCANCECVYDGCTEDPCDTWGDAYGYSCSALEQLGYNCGGCKCTISQSKNKGAGSMRGGMKLIDRL